MTRIMMQRPTYGYGPAKQINRKERACGSCHVASNILKKENGYEIQLAVPGINKEDVNLVINEDILTIEAKSEQKETDRNYKLKQFDFARFTRRFELPEDIDQDNITATYQDGILSVQLVKKAETAVQNERKIEIK